MGTIRPSSRRHFILGSTAAAGFSLAAPAILRSSARAADAALGPYQEAKINWRQCEGEALNVAIIPATFFKSLIARGAEFTALTGVKIGFEEIPPGQIRNKTVLDRRFAEGEPVRIAFDWSRLHFFDPAGPRLDLAYGVP